MAEEDHLCSGCAKIDLYQLIKSPPSGFWEANDPGPNDVFIGSVEQARNNTATCALCGLVSHVTSSYEDFGLDRFGQPGLSVSKCYLYLRNKRMDAFEETDYMNLATESLLATWLEVLVSTRPPNATGPPSLDSRQSPRTCAGMVIQLLSPASINPERPLLNGYQATTLDNGLRLLRGWAESCHESHGATCEAMEQIRERTGPLHVPDLEQVRFIDVQTRQVVELDAKKTCYAALSYVWGSNTSAYIKLADKLVKKRESQRPGHPEAGAVFLPETAPKVIEDALAVCQAIGVSYLWADLYCVAQHDPVRKAADIKIMGHIYRLSYITLIAGAVDGLWSGSSSSRTQDIGAQQRVERIRGREYITGLPASDVEMRTSAWPTRSWTFQEGQMATRVAIFGRADVAFRCCAGIWRESLHSGPYGHDGIIPGVDLTTRNTTILSASKWLASPTWSFYDYDRIVTTYMLRKLSFESDKLNAINGCLNLMAEHKGTQFVGGMPVIDFHYALLWFGESARRRDGFPTWSWAGWHADLLPIKCHFVYPVDGVGTSLLVEDGCGNYVCAAGDAPDVEMRGQLMAEEPSDLKPEAETWSQPHRCSQRLANLSLSMSAGTVTVTSEVARFSISIEFGDGLPPDALDAPGDSDGPEGSLEPDPEYRRSPDGIWFRDKKGNRTPARHDWANHWPTFIQCIPWMIRRSTLTWLLRDGLELVNIAEVKSVELAKGEPPFYHILCLGIDRSSASSSGGAVRRFGMYCLPKEMWDNAEPEEMVVTFS